LQTQQSKQNQEPIDYLFKINSDFVMFPSLQIAAKLDIAGLLKEGAKHVSQLAEDTGSHPDALYRVLRLLANGGIFSEVENRVFAQNDVSYFLREDVPLSLRKCIVLDYQPEWAKTVFDLPYSVQTNKSAFRHTHNGTSLWEYFKTHPEEGQHFSQLMTEFSSVYSDATLSEYDFAAMQTVADVGGAHGSLLSAVLQANSHLQGVLFDSPEVIEDAKKNMNTDIAKRCRLESGDFLQAVPTNVDAYIMRYILHDWSDEDCIQILKNCHIASPKAKILIVERVIQTDHNSQFTLSLDLWMLLLFDNAKERTEEEYRALLEAADYRLNRIIHTESPFSIIEGV
jgi:hypothetical protein